MIRIKIEVHDKELTAARDLSRGLDNILNKLMEKKVIADADYHMEFRRTSGNEKLHREALKPSDMMELR